MNIKSAIIGVALLAATVIHAQTPAPAPAPAAPPNFFGSVTGYFTSFNTNYDASVAAARMSLWTGADSLQGAGVPLANSLGLSYNVYAPTNSSLRLSIETVIRNSGVAGTIVSDQIGGGVGFIFHDTKFTAYADGGYDFIATKDRFYGEVGLRLQKNLTENTFAGIGIGVQFPQNRQIEQVFAGFSF